MSWKSPSGRHQDTQNSTNKSVKRPQPDAVSVIVENKAHTFKTHW